MSQTEKVLSNAIVSGGTGGFTVVKYLYQINADNTTQFGTNPQIQFVWHNATAGKITNIYANFQAAPSNAQTFTVNQVTSGGTTQVAAFGTAMVAGTNITAGTSGFVGAAASTGWTMPVLPATGAVTVNQGDAIQLIMSGGAIGTAHAAFAIEVTSFAGNP